MATGALGHGFSVACGWRSAKSGTNARPHLYPHGDGEQAEGSVWEAVMFAAKYKLDNLTAIVDRNHLQISGTTEEVMPRRRSAAHDTRLRLERRRLLRPRLRGDERSFLTRVPGKPTAIILDTVKGKGSPIMENKAEWHHLIPNDAQYEAIRADLLRAAEEADPWQRYLAERQSAREFWSWPGRTRGFGRCARTAGQRHHRRNGRGASGAVRRTRHRGAECRRGGGRAGADGKNGLRLRPGVASWRRARMSR